MELKFYNTINNELRSSEQTHEATDPRTEESLWPLPIATEQDFEDTMASAQKALPAWSRTTLAERQALLVKLTEVLTDNVEMLSEILMRETGKSKLVASMDVDRSAVQGMYYTKVGLEDELQFEDESTRIIATHVPLGVVVAISPWNFPLILSSMKVWSALVTGNCVIVKPSPFAPYAITKWAELTCARNLLPPGVFQVLNGGGDLGQRMTLHPGVALVSFTGTIATGKRVMAACTRSLKRIILELAGNDASIICADADLNRAIPNVASGGFFNAGQVCVASKRVYVHESIFDVFLDRLIAEVEKGYAVQEDACIPSPFGPVSNRAQFDAVRGIIEDCRKNGFNIVLGRDPGMMGSGAATATKKGFWIPPTIVSKPPEDSMLVQEEQFGPVLPILPWSDEDDLIKRANLSNAGLAASIYTTDMALAERLARRLESGSVYINQFERPHYGAWFGGMKESGYGGEMGKQGLLSYCYTQSLHFAK